MTRVPCGQPRAHPARPAAPGPTGWPPSPPTCWRPSGSTAADAALVAGCLVEAELWGHPSHGLLRLSWYVARIRSGVVDPLAAPEAVADRGAVAVVDGREGLGHVLAAAAARDAVRRPGSTAPGWSPCATPTTSGWPPTTPA